MKKLILFSFILISFASCEKLLMPKKPSDHNGAIFNEVWTALDKGYVHFNKVPISWDSVKKIYEPVFADSINTQQVYDSMVSMLNTMLQDVNVSLNSGFATSYYSDRWKYPANFNKSLLEQKYWPGYEQTGGLLYKVFDSVGYIYYHSFNDVVSDEQIQVVIRRLKGNGAKRGVILDIRDNAGGDPANMKVFFDHMGLDSNIGYDYTTFLYEIAYKKGPGHEDFENYKGAYTEKNSNLKFPGRIVVLTNRGVSGTANVFTSAAKSFNNVKVMGDTTGGGGAMTSSFELSNGWILTYPSARMRDGVGTGLENPIPPDFYVPMKKADEDAGVDSIFEAARLLLVKY